MTVFLDTNVLLDVLGKRHPHYAAAATVWSMVERKAIRGIVSAISFNNIYYIVRKLAGKKAAAESLRLLRDTFEVAAADAQIINQAMDSKADDFEDAVQYLSAVQARCDFLLTRDAGGFPGDAITVVSPEEFLGIIQQQESV